MKTYGYAYLQLSGYVHLTCTDPEVFDWIYAEVRKLIPSARMSVWAQYLSDEPCSVKLDKLQGKDVEVRNWIMKTLCLHGWEPFWFVWAGYDYHPLVFRRESE